MACYCDPDKMLQAGEHEPDCSERAYERDIDSRIERERERVHDFERYPTDEGGPVNE